MFAVPVVIAGFLVLVMAALVGRTVAAFVAPIMTSSVVRLLGSVRVAVRRGRASTVATLGEHWHGQYERQQQNENDPYHFYRTTPGGSG